MEAMFFPSSHTCATWIKLDETTLITSHPSDEPLTQITTKKKVLSPKQKDDALLAAYNTSPLTNDLEYPDGKFIPFSTSFKYIGSITNFTLSEKEDIELRIIKANNAMGALKHF